MNKIYALSTLLNGKITHLVHTPNASECDDPDSEMFWGLRIKVKENGKWVHKTLWILSDDEGNAPGSWEIEDENSSSV